MNIFETTQQTSSFSKSIPVIRPALRWAQSPQQAFVEVKFATRFDSPACLDIFDSEIRIDNNRTLFLSAMCRNDKKLLKYELELDLYGDVKPFDVDMELV
jgi:hypothetical protein